MPYHTHMASLPGGECYLEFNDAASVLLARFVYDTVTGRFELAERLKD